MQDAVVGRSLPLRTLAPAVMATTGMLQIVEAVVHGHDMLLLGIAGLFLPTLGTTATAHFLAQRKWKGAICAVLVWFAFHALIALPFGSSGNDRELILWCAFVCSGITFALALPAFIAIAVIARREDVEASDALLAILGGWFVLLQAAEMIVLQPESVGLPVPGLTLGAVALVVAAVRMIRRRRFCKRIAEGKNADYRLRAPHEGEPVASLPVLFGDARRPAFVVERMGTASSAHLAYRSAEMAVPVAVLGVPPLRGAYAGG